MVWMLLESFKTFDHSDIVYGFDHLGRLKVENNDLHEFIMSWNHLLDNMGRHGMQDAQLRDVFYRKIKDEPEMEYGIRQCGRLSEGHPEKTYEHLKSRVYLVTRRQEQKKNPHEREALLSAKPLRG